jgi:hypothetical protein
MKEKFQFGRNKGDYGFSRKREAQACFGCVEKKMLLKVFVKL